MRKEMGWKSCFCCICDERMEDDEPYESFEVGACHYDLSICERNNALKMLINGNTDESLPRT